VLGVSFRNSKNARVEKWVLQRARTGAVKFSTTEIAKDLNLLNHSAGRIISDLELPYIIPAAFKTGGRDGGAWIILPELVPAAV
jgi:hypothetical protein